MFIMADGDEEGDSGDHGEGVEMIDENMLEALLIASGGDPDAEDLNDLDAIDGEFTSLNNTIDELNRYLDRWELKHDRLRADIKEVLEDVKESREDQQQAKNDEAGPPEPTGMKSMKEKTEDTKSLGQESKNTGDSAAAATAEEN